MTLFLAPRRVTWSTVDSGFHVASRAGEFVGSVDMTADGSFIAIDAHATAIGRYDRLSDAKQAVVDVTRRDEPALPERVARVIQPAAATTGVVAGAMLVSAIALTPVG